MTTHSDLVSAEELEALVEAGAGRVVDCRFDLFDAEKGRTDYLAGHIPGAVYADLDRDLAGEITATSGRHPLPDAGDFLDTLRRWGIDNDTLVVACDYGNGALAARLWWMLKFWLGHERVAVLDGGITAWRAIGGEFESGESRHTAGRFDRSPDGSMIVTVDEISEALTADRPVHLVDARDATRYCGAAEPIDTIAGHIPGARNLPLSVSIDANGYWRNTADLEEIWRNFLQDGPPQSPVAMCGSGVTACHLVLSAVLAGLEAPRLYVGSWSEWIRDPGRPVVTTK